MLKNYSGLKLMYIYYVAYLSISQLCYFIYYAITFYFKLSLSLEKGDKLLEMKYG